MCMFTSFPNFALFVFICQFQGFPLGAILVHARHRGTTGVLNGSRRVYWIVDWVIAVFVGSGCCSGLKEDFIFYTFGFWTLDFDKCNR